MEHVDVEVSGNDCNGITLSGRMDCEYDDFEYFEFFYDGQSKGQYDHNLWLFGFDITESSTGSHHMKFEIHHGGMVSSYSCSFDIVSI